MASQNRLLQEELDELNQRLKQHNLRKEGSKAKGAGDTREDSPELMSDDMKSARSQKSLLDPLSYPFHYAKEKLRSLVAHDGYEVEYFPSIMPPANANTASREESLLAVRRPVMMGMAMVKVMQMKVMASGQPWAGSLRQDANEVGKGSHERRKAQNSRKRDVAIQGDANS